MRPNKFLTYEELIEATGYINKSKQRKKLQEWGLDVDRVRPDGTVAITWLQYYKNQIIDLPIEKEPELNL